MLPTYDVTARKAHQWAMVVLVALAFVLGDRAGPLPLALAGAIMLLGRVWWPADVMRQFVWRVLEPAELLRRREAHEDRVTRRLARVMGGIAWLLAAGLLLAGLSGLAWVLTGLIAVMVALDASIDFCALCFIFARLDRYGLLPAAVPHGADRAVLGEH
jgi:uncharacterized protein DUF4395